MPYSTYLCVTMATVLLGTPTDADNCENTSVDLDEVLKPVLERVRELVERFRRSKITPLVTVECEKDLQQATRELARVTTQWTYNHLEPDAVPALPREVQFESSTFRRLPQKTPQQVSTLFGPITLRRLGYRAAPGVGEPVLFPLCRELGLVHGATQKRTLERLRREHAVHWGVKRLRQVTEFVAAAMEEQRSEAQVAQLLRWLEQAQASRGRH